VRRVACSGGFDNDLCTSCELLPAHRQLFSYDNNLYLGLSYSILNLLKILFPFQIFNFIFIINSAITPVLFTISTFRKKLIFILVLIDTELAYIELA